jgi:uncharacterized protein HemX
VVQGLQIGGTSAPPPRRYVVTDPTGESKQRNREIAANESARQTVSAIRVSTWAIAVAVIIGLAAFGWVFVHGK